MKLELLINIIFTNLKKLCVIISIELQIEN